MLYDKNWQNKFKHKLISGEEAAAKIQSGMGIEMMDNAAESLLITKPMVERQDLKDVRLYMLFMRNDSAFLAPEALDGRFKLFSYFLHDGAREMFQAGQLDYIPSHNSSANRQFTDRHIDIDVAFINLTPPDKNGFFNMSFRPGMYKPMVHKLKQEKGDQFITIAIINENLPACCGDTLIHESELDFIVEDHYPNAVFPWFTDDQLGPEFPEIAKNVSTLVGDGATIELGIGKLPMNICRYLTDKNDLGIHTEILSGPVYDLITAGVATGKYKNIHPYQAVFGFALPTSDEIYEWFDRNPSCTPYPLAYVCDSNVVAAHDNFCAINSAIQVDLTGQNNSEVIHNSQWSGTGGQMDYMKGACMSKGGKSIIAIKSTAKSGTISRITGGPFYPGGVTTDRNDIHYVVTEFGIAKLEGASLRERAHALIDIAHPDFKEELIEQAKERYLW